jgi:hypothetical protein
MSLTADQGDLGVVEFIFLINVALQNTKKAQHSISLR